METKTIIIAVMLLMAMPLAGAGAKTIAVCNSCDNKTLSDANNFAVDGDIIDIQNPLLLENMNIINKNVTVEGNDNKITVSLPSVGGLPNSDYGIKASGQAILNNISLDITNTWAGAILMEDVSGVTWNNIHTEVNETLDINLSKQTPGSSTILALRSNDTRIKNFTAKNAYAPLWIRYTNNFTVDGLNISASRNYLQESDGLSGVWIDDSQNISINTQEIQGYPNGVRVGALADATSNVNRDIIIKGNGKLHKNNYGVRGVSSNLTVENSTFDNTIDIALWGDQNYRLLNNKLKAAVILPGGKIFNISVYNLPNVTILTKNYSLVNGFNITASCNTSNCTLRFYYNTTLVQNLSLNVSTFKVWHVIDEVNKTGEWITITAKNTTEGWIEITVSGFSPYYLVAEPDSIATPVPTTISPGSSGGGSSSSGGGGVVTDEDFKNINNYESKDGTLLAGKEVRFDFKKVGAGIFYTIVTGKENEYDVTIRVENLKEQSKKAFTPAPNTVYLYTNILSGSQRIASAKIGFKVSNTWLDSNKVDRSTIKMYRLRDGNWSALDTRLIGSDAENAIYEATTSGFSKFAISGEVLPSQPSAEATAPAETAVVRQTVPAVTVVPIETPKAPGFGAVVGVIGVILAIYTIRKGRQP